MKAVICTTLFLAGFVLAINDGETFPWVNTMGIGLCALAAWLANIWSEII